MRIVIDINGGEVTNDTEVEFVNGADLEIGDVILVRAVVTEMWNAGLGGDWSHPRLKVTSPMINTGDQYLWTWGKPYGGHDGDKSIVRLKKP